MSDLKQQICGITSPISVMEPRAAELEKTTQLVTCLTAFELFETEAEMNHRMSVLAQLNEHVQQWIREISSQRLPEQNAQQMRGKIFTFGSYRLGVHTKGADIDTLIVAPRHVQRSDFFSSFLERLQGVCEYARAVEEAYVPVIKAKIAGIELDLLFARLALKNIPEDQELRDLNLLKNLDDKSVRSLNGCRVTDDILQLVPNHESFRLALRTVKLWAKRRGIYSNSLGYLGGVSWAMLVARTCQLYPRACAATIVQKFFLVFSQWPWPKPVLLRHATDDKESVVLGFTVWDPRTVISDRFHLMPIVTPSYPQQNSTFNVTASTKAIITREFQHALEITDQIMNGKHEWTRLFESFQFFTQYRHFIALFASEHPEWNGLVESKIRLLVQNLERRACIALAHVNPLSYNYNSELIWFIGLEFNRSEGMNVDLTMDIRNFVETVMNAAKFTKMFRPEMTIDTKHVKRKELSKYIPLEMIRKKKNPLETKDADNNDKKRSLESDSDENERKKVPKDSKDVSI